MKSLGRVTVVLGAALAALVATGALDVQVRVRDNVARAIDLFGKHEEPQASTPSGEGGSGGSFWREGSGQQPMAPVGVPNNFADLSERVSPGVVNISTKKTV